MKTTLLLGLLTFSMGAMAETLHFSKFNTIAETAWNVLPSTTKESVMTVEFVNDRGEEMEPNGKMQVELYMPQMGHGSGPTALERVLDNAGEPLPGVYRVRNMWFVMKGAWEIRMTLKKGATSETQTMKVDL